MTSSPRATIAAGHGRYADPWHDYDANADRLAAILRTDGWTVTVEPDVDAAMRRLEGEHLLVVAAGDPWGPPSPDMGVSAASVAGLDAALARGIGLLALHTAAASLRDYPAWAPTIGAVWIPRASMHPPFEDPAPLRVLAHEMTAGLDRLRVADERYSDLQPTADDRIVLVDHHHDGRDHPVVWLREAGRARIAYDGLGHDVRSYDSEEHRELVRRVARWAGRA